MRENAEMTGSPTVLGLMKYVYIVYFAGTLLLAWLLSNLTESIWTFMNLNLSWIAKPIHGAVVVASVGVAAIVGWYMWKSPKINRLSIEVVTELSKVTWPARNELSASTLVVVVISVLAAIILGLFDFFWAWFTDMIYM